MQKVFQIFLSWELPLPHFIPQCNKDPNISFHDRLIEYTEERSAWTKWDFLSQLEILSVGLFPSWAEGFSLSSQRLLPLTKKVLFVHMYFSENKMKAPGPLVQSSSKLIEFLLNCWSFVHAFWNCFYNTVAADTVAETVSEMRCHL